MFNFNMKNSDLTLQLAIIMVEPEKENASRNAIPAPLDDKH